MAPAQCAPLAVVTRKANGFGVHGGAGNRPTVAAGLHAMLRFAPPA